MPKVVIAFIAGAVAFIVGFGSGSLLTRPDRQAIVADAEAAARQISKLKKEKAHAVAQLNAAKRTQKEVEEQNKKHKKTIATLQAALETAEDQSHEPEITAELSNLMIEVLSRLGVEAKSQFFDLTLGNLSSKEITVYVVIYAKNDRFSPPRRSAWPFAGILFHQAGTSRGTLSYHDIMRNWDSRPDNSKGCKVTIAANKNEKLEGALPINDICQHEAWRGKAIDSRANYEEWNIWVFSERGKLLLEKTYEVK